LFNFTTNIHLEIIDAVKKTEYSSKKPVYLIMGDFNFNVENHQKRERLNGWHVFPKIKDRTVPRQTRKKPIDFILMSDSAPENRLEETKAESFSPLPITWKEEENGEIIYTFSKGSVRFLGESEKNNSFSSTHSGLREMNQEKKAGRRQLKGTLSVYMFQLILQRSWNVRRSIRMMKNRVQSSTTISYFSRPRFVKSK
jgi:hypothetical protein